MGSGSIQIKCKGADALYIDQLEPFQGNLKELSKENYEKLKKEILELGFSEPMSVWSHNGKFLLLNGHQRHRVLMQMKTEGFDVPKVPVNFVEAADVKEAKKKILALTSQYGEITKDGLYEFMNEADLAFPEIENSFRFPEIDFESFKDEFFQGPEKALGSLAEKFIVPPFSVLDGRSRLWQDRKSAWIDLGIHSEAGREHLVSSVSPVGPYAYIQRGRQETGGSVFDPVLCEITYRWFTNGQGKKILDPFAGGSVRGIVADKLGHFYTGVDLSEKQISANNKQAAELGVSPKWVHGDSANLNKIVSGEKFDLAFTCPPYFDLERYSEKPNDLSNMEFGEFLKTYSAIFEKVFAALVSNAFFVVVIGDVRAQNSEYRNIVGETIGAALRAGFHFYNSAIYLTPIGNAPVRVSTIFGRGGRKLVNVHQHYLVFYKGDPSLVVESFPPLDGEIISLEAKFANDTNS